MSRRPRVRSSHDGILDGVTILAPDEYSSSPVTSCRPFILLAWSSPSAARCSPARRPPAGRPGCCLAAWSSPSTDLTLSLVSFRTRIKLIALLRRCSIARDATVTGVLIREDSPCLVLLSYLLTHTHTVVRLLSDDPVPRNGPPRDNPPSLKVLVPERPHPERSSSTPNPVLIPQTQLLNRLPCRKSLRLP